MLKVWISLRVIFHHGDERFDDKVLKDILHDVDKEIIDEQIYEFKKDENLPIYDIALTVFVV